MQLSKVNCARGAPMGRGNDYCADNELVFKTQVEFIPFVDGCYDCGGAYWGAGTDLWAFEGIHTDEHGDTTMGGFVRASNREWAMMYVKGTYPNAVFESENGSIIKQTIVFLKDWLNREESSGRDGGDLDDTRMEVDYLEEMYEEIKKGAH